jgi:hypothetical protein
MLLHRSLCLPSLEVALLDMVLAVLGISTVANCVELGFERQAMLFISSKRTFGRIDYIVYP